MAAVDYRQLSGPAQLETFNYDDGSAAAANSLAGAFRQFTADVSSVGQAMNEDAGAKAGATGDPQFKEGFTKLTAYSRAYNNAATRSYSIRAENDAEDTAARLEVQAANDPDHFRTTYTAVRDAVVAQAPPEARGLVNDIYNKRLGQGTARLTASQQTEFQKQARVDVSEGIARSTDRISNWLSSDDPVLHAQADDEQVTLSLMIDGAKNDGTITDTEAASAHIQAQRSITEQSVGYRFKNELNNPYGDPVGFIQRLQEENRRSSALPPAEEEKLVTSLFETLRQKNALESFDKRKDGREEALRYEQGDRTFTAKLLAGTLMQKDLLDGVTSQNLKPETARTLMSALHSGDNEKDDQKSLYNLKTDAAFLNRTNDEIAAWPGLTWKTKADVIEERDRLRNGWRGTQQAHEGSERIDRALGIVPGTPMQALSDDQKTQRQQALTHWYNEVDALDPAQRQGQAIKLSEDVVTRFVRKAKADDAQGMRNAKTRYISGMQQSHGDPGGYSKQLKQEFDAKVKRYDTQIDALEAEAARQ